MLEKAVKSRLKYGLVVAVILTLSGPETLEPKVAKGIPSLKVFVMITKNKSYFFSPLKSGMNDLCEPRSIAVKAGTDLVGLEGKSLKKGTVAPRQCFTDIGRDKYVYKLIMKYLQKEGEILIKKKKKEPLLNFLVYPTFFFCLIARRKIIFNFLISSYSV